MKALVALIVLAGCASKPPLLLGERMPTGCTEKTLDNERCIAWVVERVRRLTTLRVYQDDTLDAYIASVGRRLVRASGDRGEWSFRVLDTPDENAYAGLGTHIYITRGMLALLRDEDELAAVLGHEIGHALGGHTHAAMLTKQTWRESRDDEVQADETAVRLVRDAGYDPRAVPRMLRALAATDDDSPAEPTDRYPPWIERIARVSLIAEAAPASTPRVTGGEQRFRTATAHLVTGVDVRDHVLIGDTALFANIGLALDVPEALASESTPATLTIGVSVNGTSRHVIDLRLVDTVIGPLIIKSNEDPKVAIEVVPGRADSPRGKQMMLSITAKGPFAAQLAHAVAKRMRPIRADERAKIQPTLFDIAAPRALWSPTE